MPIERIPTDTPSAQTTFVQADATAIDSASKPTISIDPVLLSIPAACATLSIGRTLLYELINAGELEVIHIGRASCIRRAAIEAFVERRMRPVRKPAPRRRSSVRAVTKVAQAEYQLDLGLPAT